MIFKLRTFSFRHRHGYGILILANIFVWWIFVTVWNNPSVICHGKDRSHDLMCSCKTNYQLKDDIKGDQTVMRMNPPGKISHHITPSLSISRGNKTKSIMIDKGKRYAENKTISKEDNVINSFNSQDGGRTNVSTYIPTDIILSRQDVGNKSMTSVKRISKTGTFHHDDLNRKKAVTEDMDRSLKGVNPELEYASKNSMKSEQKAARTGSGTKVMAGGESINHTATKKYFRLAGEKVDTFVNLHRYEFTMLPSACSGKAEINIIIIIHTALTHVRKRQTLRNSLRAKTREDGFSIGFAFLIGQTKNATLQRMLQKESRMNKDLVQGNFLDTYRNLTYKHIMGYHWVVTYCKNVEYVIKIDDDVIINVQNVINYITEKQVPDGYIACSAYRKSKIKKHGKWSRLLNQFPFTRYPPYCSGFAYIIPASVVETLYSASQSVRFFWIDDVYVTGLLTLATGTELQDLSKTEAHKHLMKTPIPTEIRENALFIFYDPTYKVQT